jgi:hypothetical protein
MRTDFPHTTILYALLAVVFVVVVLLFISERKGDNTEQWTCSQVACASSTGPQEWVQSNCFETAIENGTDVVCRLEVEGVNRLIPLRELNLTDVRVCTQYACVQEVRTRTTNYSINVSATQ